jgi:hypothetical protein
MLMPSASQRSSSGAQMVGLPFDLDAIDHIELSQP